MAKAKKAPTGKKESFSAKPILEPTPDTATYYVNHVEVGHSQHEFFLLCGKLPTKLTRSELQTAKAAGIVPLEPVVQILIPSTMVEGLIRALTDQRKAYEASVGTITKLPDSKAP